jgi:hypothetical protein
VYFCRNMSVKSVRAALEYDSMTFRSVIICTHSSSLQAIFQGLLTEIESRRGKSVDDKARDPLTSGRIQIG